MDGVEDSHLSGRSSQGTGGRAHQCRVDRSLVDCAPRLLHCFHSIGSRLYPRGFAPCDRTRRLFRFFSLELVCNKTRILGVCVCGGTFSDAEHGSARLDVTQTKQYEYDGSVRPDSFTFLSEKKKGKDCRWNGALEATEWCVRAERCSSAEREMMMMMMCEEGALR